MDKPDVIVVRASLLALCALAVIGCSEREADAPKPEQFSGGPHRIQRYGPDELGVACYVTGSTTMSCMKVK